MFSSEEEVRHVRDLYHEVCARNFQLYSTKIESLKIEKKECDVLVGGLKKTPQIQTTLQKTSEKI